MNATESESLRRLAQIHRLRALRVLGGALLAVALAELLFASFVIGHATGPTAMATFEFVAGGLGAVIVGLVVGLVTASRRRNQGYLWRLKVREGGLARWIHGFSDFITIDDEVILKSCIVSVEPHRQRLVLRYQELSHGGPMLREFEGPEPVLQQLAQALQ